MTIGLGTYSFFWQWHDSADQPLSLTAMIDKTADWAARRFQICDYPAIEEYDDSALRQLRRHAEAREVTLELGTRGVAPTHLARYLHIADLLGVRLLRTMTKTATSRPPTDKVIRLLRAAMTAYEHADVTIALETYEQVPVNELIDIVESVGSPNLGICLDPANCVAALQMPRDTVEATAGHVVNVHVKDFTFTRQAGWVGFSLVGAPLGEGLLDYDHLIACVQPEQHGLSQIVEHWLPWQGDSPSTIAAEDRWTQHNLNYLRRKQQCPATR